MSSSKPDMHLIVPRDKELRRKLLGEAMTWRQSPKNRDHLNHVSLNNLKYL